MVIGGTEIITSGVGGGGSSSSANVINAASFGVKANGQFVYDAVSNSTHTITSASANFTAADIGKIVFGIDSSGNPTSPPQGVITSINNAHSIQVSVAANASNTAVSLGWGTDDSAACANAWNAAVAAETLLILPAGYIFVQSPQFNITTLQSQSLTKALGINSTGFSTIVPTPNFNFALAPFPTSGLFCNWGSGNVDMFPNNFILSNFGVYGGNQSLSGNASTNSILNLQQAILDNIWVWSYGNKANSLTGVTLNGPVQAKLLAVDGAGGTGISIEGTAGQFVILSDGTYSTNCNICLVVNSGAQLNSYGSLWGPSASNPVVSVSSGGILNMFGDYFFLGGFGFSNARSLDTTGTVNLIGCNITNSVNQYGIVVRAGSITTVSHTTFNLTAANAAVLLLASANLIFNDDGTNTYVAGTVPGLAAANITPSTGWGTSGAAGNGVSAVSGDVRRFQFTITAAGTPTPNPTIVIALPWTLPRTPFFIVQQVGGTGLVNPLTISTAATTTGMTLTWSGTPISGSTYIITCVGE